MKLLRVASLALLASNLWAGEQDLRLAQAFVAQKQVPVPEQAFEGSGFQVDLMTLHQVRTSYPERIVMPLVGHELTFTRDYVRDHGKTTTWRGFHIESGTRVVLTVSESSFYATYYAGLEKYTTRPSDQEGLFYVYRMDDSKMQPMVGCSIDEAENQAAAHIHDDDSEKTAACDASAQIDVMIVYTNGLATRLGNNLDARLQHLVDLTNDAYNSSQVDAELRLVHTMAVDYPDNTDIGDALSDITNNTGVFSDMESLRDQHGADQVTIVRNLNASGGLITCGIAWLVTTSGIQSGARSAYAAVDDHNFQCFDLAYAHEVGHNLGLAHDRNTSMEFGGGGGKFSYSFGYQQPQRKFVTVMGYDFTGVCPCGYTPNFSNPNVSVQGSPTGVPEGDPESADNAKTLGVTRLNMAQYRATLKGSSLANKYYVPEVQLTGGTNTYVGLVNNNNATASVEVFAFSSTGDQLAKLSSVTQIPANNRVWINVNAAFPSMSNLIGWIQVGSNRTIQVFAELQSAKVRSAYWSNPGLDSIQFVPHVAKNTAQFETIISTVNGTGGEASAYIAPEPFGDQYNFSDLDCGYTQTAGNAVEYFGSDLIEIVDWASIMSATSSVASMEYFSYLPDRDRVASLGLNGQTTERLRFLHVAADVTQFWTGLVYMNVGNGTLNVTERYYNASGDVLSENPVSLIRGQKRTLLFDAANNEPAGTVWVDVEVDNGLKDLVGYELFGSANGSPHKFFAGLQGSTKEGRTLVYPHARQTNGEWTGLVALNVGGSNANITFEGVNDQGNVVASKTISAVAPNVKYVATTDSLFDAANLSQITWVRATTTGSQWAGFSLWGDLGELREHLSGLVAPVSQ
ncbi:MAG: hypothetical protein KDC35_16965 [Acidobacteria bacterium]|nr:hypothetical protein [Acidobacteriota bacterium]